jgi:hypothetical protein
MELSKQKTLALPINTLCPLILRDYQVELGGTGCSNTGRPYRVGGLWLDVKHLRNALLEGTRPVWGITGRRRVAIPISSRSDVSTAVSAVSPVATTVPA